MLEPAPIAIFAYNRPDHLRTTLKCLESNDGAERHQLYIFSDAPKAIEQASAVKAVRKIIRDNYHFKAVNIIERNKNWGLAASIIDGVTRLTNEYERAIVLEDDIRTSRYFLDFMNRSLEFYEHHENVMHISGCRYPAKPNPMHQTFFLQVPLCWGWATWGRAWKHFTKLENISGNFNRTDIKTINFENTHPFWNQLLANETRKINTWFIYWYLSIYKANGLSLFPTKALSENIGFDGSGVNCGSSHDYEVALTDEAPIIGTPPVTTTNYDYQAHIDYFRSIRPSLAHRITAKLRNAWPSSF